MDEAQRLCDRVAIMDHGASWRFLHVVHRNYLVWRKLIGSALVGHLADPLIWLVGLGLGIGSLLPVVGGMTYLEFLGSGMLCYSVMNSASFEGLWSAFTRLKVQRTWESILHAPMTVTDIVVGEWVWAALKGALSGVAILVVMAILGPGEIRSSSCPRRYNTSGHCCRWRTRPP